MAKTVVKRIPVEAAEKIQALDPNFQKAILKALDLPLKNSTNTEGLSRRQKDEVELIAEEVAERKIEEARRRY